MIPIHDDNPISRAPVLTVALIVASVGAFIWLTGLDEGSREWVVFTLGAIPAVLVGEASVEPYFAGFPPEASALTLMFLHAGWLHLGGNMLYLWIFGNNVEDRLGHGRFLALYLIAGLAGTAAHIAANPVSEVPMIGASGAVSGVLGAYLLLYPHARVKMIVPPFLFRTFRVPAWLFLGFWFVFQGLNAAGVFDSIGDRAIAAEGGIAWMAHVGGFVAGMGLLLVLRPAGVPLFARPGRRVRAPGAPAPWGTSPRGPAPSAAERIVGGGGQAGTIRRTERPPGRIVSR